MVELVQLFHIVRSAGSMLIFFPNLEYKNHICVCIIGATSYVISEGH